MTHARPLAFGDMTSTSSDSAATGYFESVRSGSGAGSGEGGDGFELMVDGATVAVDDPALTLLEVVRDLAGVRSVKDGCSPQGQCGCCTVLVDGKARVACVTPARRVRGREIRTLDGLPGDERERWAEAFAVTGGSQCGFCTPGIICRFSALSASGADHDDRDVAARALAAHLCRCTGWQPVVDAWVAYGTALSRNEPGDSSGDPENVVSPAPLGEVTARPAAGGRLPRRSRPPRDWGRAARRATLEGRSAQSVGAHVALGEGGFADDTAPADALVAVRAGDGSGWVVAETPAEARRLAGVPPARRATRQWEPPLEVPEGHGPEGSWSVRLRTSWCEPGYLETDAAWCSPGGEPASALGNGGAFGGKVDSPVGAVARRLADEHGRSVRVLWNRADVACLGPKRPPIAAGVSPDGTGVIRVARTPGITEAIGACAPGLRVEQVDLRGPPTSARIRGAGWAEAAVLMAACRSVADGASGVAADTSVLADSGWISSPDGGSAAAAILRDGSIRVRVRAGEPLDHVVLRSFCIGAAHMALSWVTSESLGVDADGVVRDLTVRSFGIVGAAAMPHVTVQIQDDDGPAVHTSDAVFAATAAAVWIAQGLPEKWPTHTPLVTTTTQTDSAQQAAPRR